ncbi:signal transduction histidine kinase [Larkinella arboricola]|uniref:histidine kinase n=1 Tax=Larkinella arboricola TaxID=643671 RepID=A0A327WP75_LARAB|nr:ATP-binding protein [Larkinella arboricola]RAJ92998.1 signal transduction histidine kinase [Larkinella arboricola]
MKTGLWLFFLIVVLTGRLLAQPFTSRSLSIQHGLPEYYVSGLIQDKAGFIWVATRDGLARYDGRQFKVFRHQPFGSRSLASNVILSMQSISDTTVLLHLESGDLQLFNPITEQFTDLVSAKQLAQRQIKLAGATRTGNEQQVWGRRETQLFRFDRATRQFKLYTLPSFPNPGNHFLGNSLLLTAQKRIYMPAPGHLLEFDTQTGAFRSWDHPLVGLPGQTANYYNTLLFQRSNGEILISAAQQLLVFNPNTHRFRSIPISSPVHTQAGLIYEAPDGNVYFTHGLTVYRLSLDNQITSVWTGSRPDYQNYFHALLVDRSGVLWIGTNGDGIQQIDLRALPFKTYPYRLNFVNDLLSLEQGIDMPNWSQSNIHIYRLRLGGTAPYISVGFDGDSYQLLRSDPKNRRLQRLLAVPRTTPIPGVEGGNGIRVLPNGIIWLYDPYQGLYKADSTGRLLDTFACPVNWVSTIYPMGDWVWLASETDGLYAYDTKKRRLVRHLRYQPTDSTSLISNHILCLAADPTHPARLWVGTQEGLGRLDTRTMRFQNWTQKQGLPSTTIQTLLTDRQGNLWFSTVKGISRLDPRTGQMRHFTTADGLLDIEYRHNHAVQLPDGRLAFGGGTGITLFDPLALKEMKSPIPTVLTGLRIANVLVEPGQEGSPLSLPVNATTTLRLKPTENFLSLEFAGLQYNKPSSLRYRYQLVGIDPDWVQSGNQTIANYTQLPPGEYEFRVHAADAGGHWSPLIKTIGIIIDPPWWQTGWAYALYGLLLAGLIRAYIQYRINRAHLQQEILLKEQEARLIKQNADWQTRFFTNITHEFRTPLTLILGPLERLMEPAPLPSRASLQQQLGVMHRNARRLLRLINQLLDLAKLEAGQMGRVESRGNLVSFFGEVVDSFRLRAERKGIELTYEATGPAAEALFDAHKLETIGYNLLANALKFTPEGGHIRVLLQETEWADNPGFRLQVIDSGVGIPPEQLTRIFDRFFQGRDPEVSLGGGTGIGLFLVAEFTRLLGGQVTVNSQVGEGTMFTVTLPLKDPTGVLAALETRPDPPGLNVAAPVADSAQLTAVSAEAPLVLVVEDNDELREFIAQELAGTYRVLTAANGQEGWQVCLRELPELVISDVMMPLMDGFTLVEHIKTTPLTAHIAVMLLTAKTLTDARIKGLTAGANDYLTKPFNVQELHLRIGNLLRHQHQLRQHWQQQIGQLGGVQVPVPVAGLSADDPFLLKLYEVLDGQLTNSAFSVEQLADELAVSPRTLHRKLSTLTGSNANELMRSYRLRKAAVFLQQGCSVTEAAERAGFEGLSYFSKSFKAQFAVSPSAYLQMQKKNG